MLEMIIEQLSNKAAFDNWLIFRIVIIVRVCVWVPVPMHCDFAAFGCALPLARLHRKNTQ